MFGLKTIMLILSMMRVTLIWKMKLFFKLITKD